MKINQIILLIALVFLVCYDVYTDNILLNLYQQDNTQEEKPNEQVYCYELPSELSDNMTASFSWQLDDGSIVFVYKDHEGVYNFFPQSVMIKAKCE